MRRNHYSKLNFAHVTPSTALACVKTATPHPRGEIWHADHRRRLPRATFWNLQQRSWCPRRRTLAAPLLAPVIATSRLPIGCSTGPHRLIVPLANHANSRVGPSNAVAPRISLRQSHPSHESPSSHVPSLYKFLSPATSPR